MPEGKEKQPETSSGSTRTINRSHKGDIHMETKPNNIEAIESEYEILLRVERNLQKTLTMGYGIAEAIQYTINELKDAVKVVSNER